MIEAFTGLPGQGKTYNMTRRAFKQYKKGREVYSNFHTTFSTYFRDLDEVTHVKNALILIDEAGITLPAQEWRKIPPEFVRTIRQHRHNGLDLWYTAQDMQDVSTALRRVTQFENYCEKFLMFCKISVFEPKKRRKADCRTFHIFNKDVFDLYDTTEDIEFSEFMKKTL